MYKIINVSEYRVLVCSDAQGLFLVAELLKVSVESSKCCSIGDLYNMDTSNTDTLVRPL